MGDYWFICSECFDMITDRENAVAENPKLTALLPDIWDRPPRVATRPTGPTWRDSKQVDE